MMRPEFDLFANINQTGVIHPDQAFFRPQSEKRLRKFIAEQLEGDYHDVVEELSNENLVVWTMELGRRSGRVLRDEPIKLHQSYSLFVQMDLAVLEQSCRNQQAF